MQLLDGASALASKSELELFSIPATQCVIEASNWVTVHSKDSIAPDSLGPYNFVLEREPSFLDMTASYLHARLKITKADGTDIDAAAAGDGGALRHPVAFLNYIGASLFRTVKVFFNNRLVYDSGVNYAYRSYFETTLTCNAHIKASMLQAGGYFHDKAGAFNEWGSPVYQQKARLVAQSRQLDVLAPIHADCFPTEKLLPSKMQVRLELTRNPDAFVLQRLGIINDTEGYTVKLEHLSWQVRKVDLLASMALNLEMRLAKQPARYPIRRTNVATFQLNAGIRDISALHICQGQIPKRIVFALLDPQSYNGDYGAHSPFYLKHYNLRSMQLSVAGTPTPREPLVCNFNNGCYTLAYMNLFANLGTTIYDNGNGLSFHEFGNGYTFLVFDLSSDQADSGALQLVREGTVSLDMMFGADLPAGGVKLLAYLEYENLLYINAYREAYFDYSQ